MDDKTATETRHWRKGQLHCHTLWSDGMTLPEVALETYRRLGYDFVCLSDHELLSSDTQQWREVCPDAGQWPWSLSRAEWERAQELVPGGFDVKKTWRRTFVRLKTIPELQRQFNAAGRFLVVSGEEASCDCHMNTFNVDADIADDVPSPGEWSIEREHISWATASILRAYEKVAKPDGRSFLMMNHPYWVVWDVDPRVLLDNPSVGLMEICNSGSAKTPRELTVEKAWDFILAHRLAAGLPPVYGTGSDDAHYYDPPRIDGVGGCDSGWVMVDCPGEMTADALSQAIVRGDFYTSCGVLLDDVRFDRASGTLSVRAKAEPGVGYHIDFIATKRDFDRTVAEMTVRSVEEKIFYRTLPVVPESIGRVVARADGPEGSYTLAPDDLYVRAVVVSDAPAKYRIACYPETKRAWVQPVRHGDGPYSWDRA